VGHERADGPGDLRQEGGADLPGPRDVVGRADYSEQTAIEIDGEIRRIVQAQYDLAKKLLTDNRDALDRIAHALLEYETLDGADVDQLLRGQALTRPKPAETRLKTPDEPKGTKRPEARF
jgi:cell division protease FtsH